MNLCRDGHADLAGPLYRGVITKDGTVHLVGHGRADHAGSGDDDVLRVLRAVIAEKRLPPDDEADTDGNRHFYGLAPPTPVSAPGPTPAPLPDARTHAHPRPHPHQATMDP